MTANARSSGDPSNTIEKAGLKAEKQVAKELGVNPKDLDAAVKEAAAELGNA